MFAILEFRLQEADRAANHAPLHLHQTPIERDAAVHGGEKAEGALAPDVGGLDRRAVFQDREQREDRAFRKIGVLENSAGFADDSAKLERDGFKVGINPGAAGRLQGIKQPVGLCVTLLSFWHELLRPPHASAWSTAQAPGEMAVHPGPHGLFPTLVPISAKTTAAGPCDSFATYCA